MAGFRPDGSCVNSEPGSWLFALLIETDDERDKVPTHGLGPADKPQCRDGLGPPDRANDCPVAKAMGRQSVIPAGCEPQVMTTPRSAFPKLAVTPYFTLCDGVLGKDFASCLTVRVTETLRRVHGLRVTSSTSTFQLPSNLPVAEIGRLLSVDYVLKGQILRVDQTIHVTQRLYDAAAGALIEIANIECGIGHLESFERDVVARVVADVRNPLQEAEIDRIMGRRPRDPSAYELVIRAQIAIHKLHRRSLNTAKRHLERAVSIDPTYAAAYAWLARLHSLRVGQGWSKDARAECEEAFRLAELAVSLDPENSVALATAGHLNSYLRKNYEAGEQLLRRATASDPNDPLAWLLLSATLAYVGKAKEGRLHAEYAMSLSPLDSCNHMFLVFGAICAYAEGDYEGAENLAKASLAHNHYYSTTYKVLAVALVGQGKISEARDIATRLLRIEPDYPAKAARTVPFRDPIQRDLFLKQLRTAGCFERQPRRIELRQF
jgi:adenylate cyclase